MTISARWLQLVAGLVVALLMTACAPVELVDASGEEIYAQLCARCHGAELEGGAAPAIVVTADTSEQDLAGVIRDGVGSMAGFETTLGDEQIGRLVDYLMSTGR